MYPASLVTSQSKVTEELGFRFHFVRTESNVRQSIIIPTAAEGAHPASSVTEKQKVE